MNRQTKYEKGQALILIAISMVGIISLTALAMDSGNAFADRRQAQNAADTAAMAAAFAKANDDPDWVAIGEERATSNGYSNDANSSVAIFSPPTDGFYAGDDKYLQVTIISTVETWFASIVGVENITNRVFAVARAEPGQTGEAFFGNAIVGLATEGTCFDADGNTTWDITGGGIMVNSDTPSQGQYTVGCNGDDVFAPEITTPGDIGSCTNISDQNEDMEQMPFPPDTIIFPREPSCNGTADEATIAQAGYDYTFEVEANKDGSVLNLEAYDQDYIWLNPGVYCIPGDNNPANVDYQLKGAVSGDYVMLYFMEPTYQITMAGGSSDPNNGFNLTAPTVGEYAGMVMYFPLADPPYNTHQQISLRGNANGSLVGTVMAPSAFVTMTGNSETSAFESQIIGFCIGSGGGGTINVQYNDDQNYDVTVPPFLELVQ